MKFPSIIKNFPHFLHGGDYNPEQWLDWKDTVWKEDMRLAKLAHINSLSVGIFAWATLEPEEGLYQFDWLDQVLDMLAENKLVAVLATPSGARPPWMSQKYPEVLRVNANRQRRIHGERHNHCMSSPVYLEKTRAINTALAKRYKDHPALGLWHISNEVSGECHCDLCQNRFRAYLKEKYTTLDALNRAWWNRFWSNTFTDWEQIESPSPLGQVVHNGLRLDWRRFTTEQHRNFYLNEIAPLKQFTPDVPCTTNLMAGYTGIDYARLAEVMDVISWDSYPQWTGHDEDIEVGAKASYHHDLMRGLKRKPFMLMESSPSAQNWRPVAKLHRPGLHMLQCMQAVAHGADTVQYFQFRKGRGGSEQYHGAVVDHEGSENSRVFRDIAAVGERLETLDGIIGTDTPAKIALVHDYQVGWALEDAKGFLQDKTDYQGTVFNHYREFWKRGIPVDLIDSRQTFDKYTVLIAPMLYMLREGVAARIEAFVKQGGTFVATYITGYVDESALAFTGGFPGPLKNLLGIWCEEIDALSPDERNSISWQDKSYAAFGLCELIHLRGAEALGHYGSDFYAGTPALTVNQYGVGKAYFIAARTEADFLADFYQKITEEAHIHPAFAGTLPKGVSAQVRGDEKEDYLFLLNFTNREQTINLGETNTLNLPPYNAHIILENKKD